MKTVPLEQITCNLDSKRIPLNGSERAKRSQTKLYPYIGANNIVDYIDDYIFDEKILCVAEDGGSWGKNEMCAKIYSEKCWVNNHAHVLTAKTDLILEYLASYLNYANLNPYITGTTRGKLTRKQLDSVEIPLPPIADQKRIAYLLGKVEGLIAQRKQHLQQLDDLLKSVLLEMFGDPSRNEKRWKMDYLGNLTSDKIGYGIVQPGNPVELGVPVIRVGDFVGTRIDTKNITKVSEEISQKHKNSILKGDEILLACVGATIGKVAVIERIHAGYNIVRATARIRATRDVNRLFLAHFLLSDYAQNYYCKVTRSVGQPTLNIKQIGNYLVSGTGDTGSPMNKLTKASNRSIPCLRNVEI
jgi:type I restriction enzyme, S subunit